MKRSPLARTRMKRKRRRARPDKDDPVYLAWIRRQPCCAPGCRARPPSDPHHETGHGMGLRAPDRRAMPLCRICHDAIDAFTGPFKGWTREQRAGWQAAMVAYLNDRYARMQAIAAAMQLLDEPF